MPANMPPRQHPHSTIAPGMSATSSARLQVGDVVGVRGHGVRVHQRADFAVARVGGADLRLYASRSASSCACRTPMGGWSVIAPLPRRPSCLAPAS